MSIPKDIAEGFSPSQIGHVASEVDHDVRNEDWDDEKKGWDKVRWNNRAMGMALVTIRKLEEKIERMQKYMHENKLHLADCQIDNWKICTCGLIKDEPRTNSSSAKGKTSKRSKV